MPLGIRSAESRTVALGIDDGEKDPLTSQEKKRAVPFVTAVVVLLTCVKSQLLAYCATVVGSGSDLSCIRVDHHQLLLVSV